MKHWFIAATLMIFLNTILFAQTEEEKLKYVRSHFYATENAIDQYTEKEYIYKPYGEYPPWGYYSFWYDKEGNLVKANYSIGEEGYGTMENYYFDAGKLYFVFTEDYEPAWEEDAPMSQYVSETRVYFYHEKVFLTLVRSQTSEDNRPIEKIPHATISTSAEREAEYLKRAGEFLSYSKQAE